MIKYAEIIKGVHVLKRSVAIMHIRSSKITVIVGSLGINNTFFVYGKGESEYSGFLDGEILEPDKMELAIGSAISNAEATSGVKITSLYIGVPAEFSFVKCFDVNEIYNKKTVINEDELSRITTNVTESNFIEDKTIIACNPIFYIFDDNRRNFEMPPYKVKSSKVSIKLSLIYVENYFINIINSILTNLNIKFVEYISTPLAEAKYLLSKIERNKKAIIIDSDYLTTSVIEVFGNGLMALNTFSIGGGHITADLSEYLNLPFNSAEKLKNKIILSINSKRMDCYEVDIEDKVLSVPINYTNEIVLKRLDMMANLIKKCLTLNGEQNTEIDTVYLTGNGLSYINGARENLAKYLGIDVELLVPSMPSMAKPSFSSALSVLYVALNDKKTNKQMSWIKKILKF